jgi:hypothetical protein
MDSFSDFNVRATERSVILPLDDPGETTQVSGTTPAAPSQTIHPPLRRLAKANALKAAIQNTPGSGGLSITHNSLHQGVKNPILRGLGLFGAGAAFGLAKFVAAVSSIPASLLGSTGTMIKSEWNWATKPGVKYKEPVKKGLGTSLGLGAKIASPISKLGEFIIRKTHGDATADRYQATSKKWDQRFSKGAGAAPAAIGATGGFFASIGTGVLAVISNIRYDPMKSNFNRNASTGH